MEKEITYDDVLMFIVKNKDNEEMMGDLNRTTFAFTAKYKHRYKGQDIKEKETPDSIYQSFMRAREWDWYAQLSAITERLLRSLINQVYNFEKNSNWRYYQDWRIFDHYFLSGIISGFCGKYGLWKDISKNWLLDVDLWITRLDYSSALHFYIMSTCSERAIPELDLSEFPITPFEFIGDVSAEEVENILHPLNNSKWQKN